MPAEIVEFEWDEVKRRQNVEKHAIDFPRAALVFDGRPAVMVHSPRGSEDRWRTTAEIEGRMVTVVWTWRENRCRIISARRARDVEERAYRQIYA